MTQPAAELSPAAPETADPEALSHIHRVVEESRTSFLWAMKLLERRRREAMFAIYCFCREIDDIADDPAPPREKTRRLADWRKEIELLYEGRPRCLTARALAGPVAEFNRSCKKPLAASCQ